MNELNDVARASVRARAQGDTMTTPLGSLNRTNAHAQSGAARAKPRLSIGIPVYNGEKYIEEALDSILAQTYQDFELIISDNASTDQTQSICLEYASKDSRIRYHRNERNLGAVNNFNRVFKLSKGEFFKWASYDDVLATNYLSRCIRVLEKDPSIVLCHSKTECIGENGEQIGTQDYNIRSDSLKSHERFNSLINMRQDSWVLIFGVIRASSLRRTSLMGQYIGTDRNLLAELSIIGRLYLIPEYLFSRRIHPQAYSERHYKNLKEKLNWWTQAGRINLPYVKIFIEYFRAVRRFPLKQMERLRCYAQVIKWFLREGWFLMGLNLGKIFLGDSTISYKLYPIAKRFLKLWGFKVHEM